MARESKIFHGNQDDVKHYECFGWELLSFNHGEASMTRETTMDHRSELLLKEQEYEDVKNEINNMQLPATYKKASFKLGLFLFILCIFPCVLYLVFKNKEKQRCLAEKAAFVAKQKELYAKLEDICNEAKALAFTTKQ